MSEVEYREVLDAINENSRRRRQQRIEMEKIIPFSGEGGAPNGGWLEEHNVPGIINSFDEDFMKKLADKTFEKYEALRTFPILHLQILSNARTHIVPCGSSKL